MKKKVGRKKKKLADIASIVLHIKVSKNERKAIQDYGKTINERFTARIVRRIVHEKFMTEEVDEKMHSRDRSGQTRRRRIAV